MRSTAALFAHLGAFVLTDVGTSDNGVRNMHAQPARPTEITEGSHYRRTQEDFPGQVIRLESARIQPTSL